MQWVSRVLEDKLETYHILARLQFASLSAVFLLFLYSLRYVRTPSAFLLVLGVGLIGAGASYAAGFLLGLIFGIPRTPPRAPAAAASPAVAPGQAAVSAAAVPASGSDSDVESNSNLVEISDWLTKIFVGVGLVELGKIPAKLEHLAAFLAMGLRSCPVNTSANPNADLACLQASQALAMGIIVFFTISGFLFGYLWARLYFQRALGQINKVKQDVKENKSSIFIALSRLFTGLGTWQDPKPQQIGSPYYQNALDQLDEGLSQYPKDQRLHFEMGIVLKSYAMSQQPPNMKMIERALAHMSESYRLAPDNPNAPYVLYNIACYQALTGKDISLVVDSLKAAFQSKPELASYAWADDDLASVQNRPEFLAAAGPRPKPPNPQNQQNQGNS